MSGKKDLFYLESRQQKGCSKRATGYLAGFTLTEVLIAVVLMTLIILSVTSIDLTSRQFFKSTNRQSKIQDEVKITMQHIVKNVQIGVGDMSNPRSMGADPTDATGCSRGFYILDSSGLLASSGNRLQVKRDEDIDGKFTSSTDRILEYRYESSDYTLRFYEDIGQGSFETVIEGIILPAASPYIFSFSGSDPSQVNVNLTVREDPTQAEDPTDNRETNLSSSINLRGMSCN